MKSEAAIIPACAIFLENEATGPMCGVYHAVVKFVARACGRLAPEE
jgi:hypothetical protein